MKRTLLCILIMVAATNAAISQTNPPRWKTMPEPPPMPRPHQSGLAPVNGIKLYYAVYNQKGTAPVILLHGGFTSSDEWGFEVPLLAKTHQVIVVDSRGHGRSSLGTQPLSYELMASDILQLMDQLKIKKASIVGWSDGGIIGMILAIKDPQRIHKLFTFGANYNLSGYKDEPSDTVAGARFMARATANYRRLSPTPDDFGQLKKALGRMYSAEPSLDPEALQTIQVPTVIACGRYDQFIKQEHFRELAKLIPNAKLIVLPDIAHGGPLQDPGSFHRAVADLLDDNPK